MQIQKQQKKAVQGFNPYLVGIKTDLCLKGVSKGFASLASGAPSEPTSDGVCESCYKQGDAHVVISGSGGLHLHVSPGKKAGDFCLTLAKYKYSGGVIDRTWVSTPVVQEAVEWGRFIVFGRRFPLEDVTPLRKLLPQAELVAA